MTKRLDLPETPDGFKKKMAVHYNFGSGKNGGGVGVYEIFDSTGARMPFGWQYDTRPDGLNGFIVREVEGRTFTWAELREYFAAADSPQSSPKP